MRPTRQPLSLFNFSSPRRFTVATKASPPDLDTWSCVEGKGSANFSLKLRRALLNTKNVSTKPNIILKGHYPREEKREEERNKQSTAVNLTLSPDGTLQWKTRDASLCTDAHGWARPTVRYRGERDSSRWQISLVVDTVCLCTLGALSLDFLDKPLVTACQGTSAASPTPTLLQILILLPNAYYLLQIHFVHGYKPPCKTAGMTRFSRSKAGLDAPQPLSGFLFCWPLLCQESHQQDLSAPLYCHQTHLLLIFKAVSGSTYKVGVHRMHTSGTCCVNHSRSKASDASDLGKTSGCAQSSESISPSLWFSKIQANSLLHVEMGEGEGKEPGEQRQDER